ncbi:MULTISPECIES: protein-ADP-ribose hydrolase [Allobacillus]|uniref:Protein-ADP-ribose hydrolase n=1 Tax=Allobacillus salarius TaxID=1955272 RepID=A0A556PDB8_9BACI|nr:protein-ADP-ribose hydrolase [Allobacillus salarius]TSJ62379.1 protein-ADP-ribose hydrolase [Allobacillus salarius]
MLNQEDRLDYLIRYLLEEKPNGQELAQSELNSMDEKFELFRGLCNVREAKLVSDEFIETQDAFLTEWNHDRKITRLDDLQPVQSQIYLWKGDITTLAVDAIVNAANSRLLGCTQANHDCIDNIIHTRAGVQLRLACDEIMTEQGRMEAAGKAKLTDSYNLPSSYVIHTVGPFIDERGVSPIKEQLLASCYSSCLKLADEQGLDTIAFCCIATGEFNFPNERAAEIAIQTVKEYLSKYKSKLNVIFNVFSEEDLTIYENLLVNE